MGDVETKVCILPCLAFLTASPARAISSDIALANPAIIELLDLLSKRLRA